MMIYQILKFTSHFFCSNINFGKIIIKIIFFLLGNSPASEFYFPKFKKSQHLKFRRRGITQKEEYNNFIIILPK